MKKVIFQSLNKTVIFDQLFKGELRAFFHSYFNYEVYTLNTDYSISAASFCV